MTATQSTRSNIVPVKFAHGGSLVGDLAAIVGLSQGGLSQRLGKMRAKGLVEMRREAQTVYYRIGSDHVRAGLKTLHAIYCAPTATKRRRT